MGNLSKKNSKYNIYYKKPIIFNIKTLKTLQKKDEKATTLLRKTHMRISFSQSLYHPKIV